MLSLIATLQTLGLNLKARLNDEKGATAVEYGLIVSLIAIAIIGGVTFLGTEIDTLFRSIGSKI